MSLAALKRYHVLTICIKKKKPFKMYEISSTIYSAFHDNLLDFVYLCQIVEKLDNLNACNCFIIEYLLFN